MSTMTHLNLAYGLTFKDLYDQEGLEKIDRLFLASLPAEVSSKLRRVRQHSQELSHLESSEFLLIVAEKCEEFIYRLFSLNGREVKINEAELFKQRYQFKRAFVQRKAIKK